MRASMFVGAASKRSAAGVGHALPRVDRQVAPERAVGQQQALDGDALQIGQLDGAHAIAQQEEQSPKSLCHQLLQRHAHLLRIGELQVPVLEPLEASTLEFSIITFQSAGVVQERLMCVGKR